MKLAVYEVGFRNFLHLKNKQEVLEVPLECNG